MTELEKLLARAVELEQKADAIGVGDAADEAAVAAAAVAEALAESSEPGVDPVADAEAADEPWVDDPADHEAIDEGEVKGFDFDPEGVDLEAAFDAAYDVKAGGGCPECGSTERDELVDGRVLCGSCGYELEPASGEEKGFDFDDLDAEVPWEPVDESKALTDAGDESTQMDELDLLRARRVELGY
jgi:rubredoxin